MALSLLGRQHALDVATPTDKLREEWARGLPLKLAFEQVLAVDSRDVTTIVCEHDAHPGVNIGIVERHLLWNNHISDHVVFPKLRWLGIHCYLG